jgi:hypothetical protein
MTAVVLGVAAVVLIALRWFALELRGFLREMDEEKASREAE